MFYLGFKGRLGRAKFWLLSLSWTGLLLSILLYVVHPLEVGSDTVKFSLVALLFIAFYYVQLSLLVRRLHDIGKSGWWYVPYFFIPTTYLRFFNQNPEYEAPLIVSILIVLLAIFGMLNAGFAAGTKGPNKYDVEPAPVAA